MPDRLAPIIRGVQTAHHQVGGKPAQDQRANRKATRRKSLRVARRRAAAAREVIRQNSKPGPDSAAEPMRWWRSPTAPRPTLREAGGQFAGRRSRPPGSTPALRCAAILPERARQSPAANIVVERPVRRPAIPKAARPANTRPSGRPNLPAYAVASGSHASSCSGDIYARLPPKRPPASRHPISS